MHMFHYSYIGSKSTTPQTVQRAVKYALFIACHYLLLLMTFIDFCYHGTSFLHKNIRCISWKNRGFYRKKTGLHVRYQIGIWVRRSPARVATMLLKREVTRKPLPAAGPSLNIRYLWIKQVFKRLLSTTYFRCN